MKGAIPIPYIVALVLAIAVIALIVYWLFFSGGEFDRMIREKGCDAKKLAYCNEYKASSETIPSFTKNGCEGMTDTEKENYYAPECCTFKEKFSKSFSDLCSG